MTEGGRGDEAPKWQRGHCTRWHTGEGTENKYTRNSDPEDTKTERKGRQRIVGLLVDMDESSFHRILLGILYFRCRQTTGRQQCAKLTTYPYCPTPGISLKHFAKNILWFLFVFYTISSSISLLLWLVKPKPLIKHQIKKMHITKAFFIPEFEQSWHFTYIHNTHQLKGFTGQTCCPRAIVSIMDSLLNLYASKGWTVDI